MQIGKWKITGKDAAWFIACLLLVISVLGGMLLIGHGYAMDVLSGAATLVSIVLSVVAILYTMIEGESSHSKNEEAIKKLSDVENKLLELQEKRVAQANTKGEMRAVLEMIYQTEINKQSTQQIGTEDKNPEILNELQRLKKILDDDIED